jgi:nucleotide-binding universal stress UspA family protein
VNGPVNRAGVVVVGCDGSPRSDSALRFAAEEARLRRARLILVASYQRPIDPELDDFDVPEQRLRDLMRARVDSACRRALGPAADDGAREILVVRGEPAKVLLEQGRDAIMIVIGRSDRRALSRVLGHFTGRKLLRHARVPVVMVPTGS